MRKHPILFSIIICLVSVLITSTVCSTLFVMRFGGKDSLQSTLKLAQIRTILEHYYIGDVESKDLIDAAASAMIEETGDRWSYYMTAEEYAAFEAYTSNQYSGIGISVALAPDGSGLLIAEILPDSPAERAGIKAGVTLVRINDIDMAGKTVDETRQIILENEDKEILLVVKDAAGEEQSFRVHTEMLPAQVVYDAMLENNIGYIRIQNFEDGAGDGTIKALTRLLDEGAEGIVFDVRVNPGGQVGELIKILDHILPEGTVFISVDKSGKETHRYSGPDCVDVPMCVLVDENTYSAAEFFAAALSEYEWASLVGTQTTGKSRSQSNVMLSDGSVMHISVNRYLTPKRVDLFEQGGLVPDLVVAFEGETDTQLEAALELLHQGK